MTTDRTSPLEISPDEFRALGHALIDQVADWLGRMPSGPVTRGETPGQLRPLIGGDRALPNTGIDATRLLDRTFQLLTEHGLFNSHPRFWGYITAPAAPIGILGDMLASAMNPNVGSQTLAPIATEIERQTVRWIAELIGFPVDAGGLLVSGGNMANMVCFLAARAAKLGPDARKTGIAGRRFAIYTSAETHTWLQKASDLYGFGTDCIRWIPVDDQLRMRADSLGSALEADAKAGIEPLLVVGTAGSVGTGAIDPLIAIRTLCDEYKAWMHVDGAYGALAACMPDASAELKALSRADSVAVDPHKWLYAPLEAGCALVRNQQYLLDAFSWHPVYYHFGGDDGELPPTNYYEYGPQNSRGFRALKVWLQLQQAGRSGYERMIADDCALAKLLYELVLETPRLEALTHGLSITTFRYVPTGAALDDDALNALNTEILSRIQREGEAFVSNHVVHGRYALRACVVNFRTTDADIRMLPALVVRTGDAIVGRAAVS